MIVFGCLKNALGLSKTWIPYSTSIKNRGFKVLAAKTTLGGTLEALWKWLEPSSEPFSEAFWEPFGKSDRGPRQRNSFFSRLRMCWSVLLLSDSFWGGFWVIFESIFCAVQSCFFDNYLIVRSWIFRTLSEGHCGRCALHLSHALDILLFSQASRRRHG